MIEFSEIIKVSTGVIEKPELCDPYYRNDVESRSINIYSKEDLFISRDCFDAINRTLEHHLCKVLTYETVNIVKYELCRVLSEYCSKHEVSLIKRDNLEGIIYREPSWGIVRENS